MKRKIVEFQQDKMGDWFALLECGHGFHIRHDPPYQDRAWVLTEEGRSRHIGFELICKKCDEAFAGREPIEPHREP